VLPEEDAGDEPSGQDYRRDSLSSRGQHTKGQEMKIDSEIRHVTKPGANLFLELGFSPTEAKRLHAASRKQINDTKRLKEQLMAELAAWIEKHSLKQAEAADILMVSRPRVSDVVNKKTSKFTIDTLVEMLSRVGKPVRLTVD
jgi:predicted XRE-type DNA-binding protein